jgi:hypothetical protein
MQAGPAPSVSAEAPRPYRTYTPSTSVAMRSVAHAAETHPENAPVVAPRPAPVAARAEPTPSRFAPPPVPPVAEEPPDGPVPGYEADHDSHHEVVSAFAPPDAEPDPAEDSYVEPGPGEVPEVVAAPPMAASESPEGDANREGVSELEQEMARLLNQISTSRRE